MNSVLQTRYLFRRASLRPPIRVLVQAVIVSISVILGGTTAAAQSQGPSVEACIGCHAMGEPAQVGNITQLVDLHYTDTNPDGPETASGYRTLNVDVTATDVRGVNTIVEFTVTDEHGTPATNIFDTDGRLILGQLAPGFDPSDPTTERDPSQWLRIVSEGFTSGNFVHLSAGAYRYTAVFDPTTVPIVGGETLRAGIQLSASDIPAVNAWCDFDADMIDPNDCVGPTNTGITRDIIHTPTCNGCHGVTAETQLSFHGGGRTELEYCVLCHNPDRNPSTGMTTLTHKIHYGSELTQDDKWEDVNFPRDIDNCTSCHESGPKDADNWKTQPNREACGSCHDDVDFDTGVGHGIGGQQLHNLLCANCHPPDGAVSSFLKPISTVHPGLAREQEGALYRGSGNGFAIELANYERTAKTLTIQFSVTRDGQKMDLLADAEWSNGGKLMIDLGWSSEDYTNAGSKTPSPAQPMRFSALDIGNTVTDLQNGSYETVIDVSTFGFGSMTIGLEGYPRADLQGTGAYSSVPVQSAFMTVSVEQRAPAVPHRQIIDMDLCNLCHDSGGAGLTMHGTNRAGEMQVCALCHNPKATDIAQRPADPNQTPDGKREESIDMKRMIHQIHMGGDLEEPVVIYGHNNTAHEYEAVTFLGNMENCLTCHVAGTYSADDAWRTLPTTIDSGADATITSDDLNISPGTSVCSSCHDTDRAKEHMVDYGGTFGSFESEIAIASPEPDSLLLALSALGTLGLLARQRRRASERR